MSLGRALLLGLTLAVGCARSPAGPVNGIISARSAGVRFPKQPDALRDELDHLLEGSEAAAPGSVTALVVPHAGLEFSGKAAAAAFAAVRDRRFARVVLLAPSHARIATGAVLPAARAFRTPLGDVPVETAALSLLAHAPGFHVDDLPFLDEHAIDAVLPFVQKTIGAVPLVPVLVGPTDLAGASQLARALAPLVDSRTLVIVSTNFTHHGPRFGNTPFDDHPGAPLRARITQADTFLLRPLISHDLAAFDAVVRSSHAGVCGADALDVLLALLPPGAQGVVRSYDNSFNHDDSTPADQVSYAGIVFGGSWPDVAPFPDADRDALLKAAREALVAAANSSSGESAPGVQPPLTSPRLLERRGLVLTLSANDEVRATVGQVQSDEPLGRTVLTLAKAAPLHGGGPPLTSAELPVLRLELAVLGPLRAVRDLAELSPGRQGLYVESGGHSALLLPEGPGAPLPTLDGVLDRLAEKSGLARAQITPATLRSFDAVLLSEPQNASSDAGRR